VVTAVSSSNGGLSATISASTGPAAPNNRLQQLRLPGVPNAAVEVRGQIITTTTTVSLPDRPQSVAMFVRRTGGSDGVTIPVTVVDDCGDWQTLLGGGASLFVNQPLPTPTSVPATATAVPPTATSIPATATATAVPGGQPAPVAGQQCPAWVHDRYTAAAPDGRQYPTWHPPTDPTYRCWFGHEHGDDPTGSPALRGRPAPAFGYVGAQAGDNEPHVGFKVFRWDDVRHPNAPNHDGASLLMAVHQGTAGAARFTAVHHSVVFHYYNPRDGREVHLELMAPFGALLVGCGANDPNMVLSQQQANVPGARQVAADKCFDAPAIPYEDWITAMYVGTDGNGGWRAYVDPHFAVFNPNTYCIPSGGACQLAYSDVRAGTGAAPTGPQSWFKGERREAYLNQVWVDNAGQSTSVWTDAFGRLAPANAPGAIPQFISAQDLRPSGNSAAFGADRDHDDGSVRPPN